MNTLFKTIAFFIVLSFVSCANPGVTPSTTGPVGPKTPIDLSAMISIGTGLPFKGVAYEQANWSYTDDGGRVYFDEGAHIVNPVYKNGSWTMGYESGKDLIFTTDYFKIYIRGGAYDGEYINPKYINDGISWSSNIFTNKYPTDTKASKYRIRVLDGSVRCEKYNDTGAPYTYSFGNVANNWRYNRGVFWSEDTYSRNATFTHQ